LPCPSTRVTGSIVIFCAIMVYQLRFLGCLIKFNDFIGEFRFLTRDQGG
jgi:hypothetical protein